ncbi:MAG TPA: hypothetical protein VN729_09680, partial [Ktedonobacteraceae bacterium]|nr:hypothetical protein [Ktedonobacteraceae bacterium]
REMVMTPEHDGRIVSLIMRDLAKKFATTLRTTSIVYHLSGRVGGTWQLGSEAPPAATLHLDVVDFNLLASGRLTPEEAWSCASLEGEVDLAREALKHTHVPY